jgi:hypothetical protein
MTAKTAQPSRKLIGALQEIRNQEQAVIETSHLRPSVFQGWLEAADEFARSYPNVERGDLCLQVIFTWICPVPGLTAAREVLQAEMERVSRRSSRELAPAGH